MWNVENDAQARSRLFRPGQRPQTLVYWPRNMGKTTFINSALTELGKQEQLSSLNKESNMCQDENRADKKEPNMTLGEYAARIFMGGMMRETLKEVTPESLLNKTVRYRDPKKNASNTLLTVVAVYSPQYKNYESSKDNIRVKNAKGTMWTCHHSEVVQVVEVKTYAYVSRRGQVIQFASEEAGDAEMERRANDAYKWEARQRMTSMASRHPSQDNVLERAPQFDQSYGEKEVE